MQRIAPFVLVVFSFLLVPASSQAINPAGTYADVGFFDLNSIWDVESIDNAGTEELCDFEPGMGELCFYVYTEAPVLVDPKGRLVGTGYFRYDFSINGEIFEFGAVFGPLKGKLKNKDGLTYFDAKFKAEGMAEFFGASAGPPLPLKAQFKMEGMVDEFGDSLSFSFGKLCVKSLGCVPAGTMSELTNLGDGSWLLQMDITEDERGRLTGTALADTALGPVPFTIKGKYNEKKDESSLKLTPVDFFKGCKIDIKAFRVLPLSGISGQAKYKVGGYEGKKVDFFAPWVSPSSPSSSYGGMLMLVGPIINGPYPGALSPLLGTSTQ